MKVTIKDIARLANVSTATVSKVINNKTYDISDKTINKVNKIIKEQNYIPNSLARSMVTKTTKTIGLIIPDVRNPFFTDLVRGAEDIANENGYNLFFCNTDDNLDKEINYINTLVEKQVDGIALAGAANRELEIERKLKVNIPIVTLDRNVYFNGIKGKIEVDNYKGAYEAVSHLISLGHREILFLLGSLDIKPSKDRLNGYKKALYDHNLKYDDRYVIEGTYERDFGKKIINELNGKLSYTAIFCGNDLIAIGAIKSLKEQGYNIPKDISVVGFDDIHISSLITPSLTTVNQPSYKIGYKAVKLLIDILDKKITDYKTIVIEPKLVIRESTLRR